MQTFLITLYAASLILFTLTDRVKRFVWLLAFQGLLLFLIAFLQLKHIELLNLLFILLETIVIKTLAIPYFLMESRKTRNVTRLVSGTVPAHYSLFIVLSSIIFSFLFTNSLQVGEHIETPDLFIAFAAFLSGVYFIVSHRNIFLHLIGYLIIENGVFLLSLAVGSEVPYIINIGILIDIFMSLVILSLFVQRIGDVFKSNSAQRLTSLKD